MTCGRSISTAMYARSSIGGITTRSPKRQRSFKTVHYPDKKKLREFLCDVSRHGISGVMKLQEKSRNTSKYSKVTDEEIYFPSWGSKCRRIIRCF